MLLELRSSLNEKASRSPSVRNSFLQKSMEKQRTRSQLSNSKDNRISLEKSPKKELKMGESMKHAGSKVKFEDTSPQTKNNRYDDDNAMIKKVSFSP